MKSTKHSILKISEFMKDCQKIVSIKCDIYTVEDHQYVANFLQEMRDMVMFNGLRGLPENYLEMMNSDKVNVEAPDGGPYVPDPDANEYYKGLLHDIPYSAERQPETAPKAKAKPETDDSKIYIRAPKANGKPRRSDDA